MVNLRERTASMTRLSLSESIRPEVPDVALRHCVMAASQAWGRVGESEGGEGARCGAQCVFPRECADLQRRVKARGPCWG